MKYKLNRHIFDEILPSQREELLKSFSDFNTKGDFIEIFYEDHNYKCMPLLEKALSSKIHALSFFSGCGGLDIGTQIAGVKVLTSLDFDKDAVATLRSNKFFSHTQHFCEDIRNVTASNYSSIIKQNNPEKLILVGGPPCQPFSKAGYWKTLPNRLGPDDPRNMITSYLNLVSEIKPDGFILENVESILHPHNIQAIYDLQETLDEIGYHYIVYKANAINFGVPQKRKRVFVIASRNKIKNNPKVTHSDDKNDNLLSIDPVINWIGRFDADKYSSDGDSAEGKYYEMLRKVPPGTNYISLTERRGYSNPYFIAGKRYWLFLLKLHPLLPSWTILSQPGHWEGPFHWRSRRLRSEEIRAIQTFPLDYKIIGSRFAIHKQVGNAVPCLLGKAMIECLLENI